LLVNLLMLSLYITKVARCRKKQSPQRVIEITNRCDFAHTFLWHKGSYYESFVTLAFFACHDEDCGVSFFTSTRAINRGGACAGSSLVPIGFRSRGLSML